MFSNFLPEFLKISLEAVGMATDTQQKELTNNYMFYVTTHKLRKSEKNLRLCVPSPQCKM